MDKLPQIQAARGIAVLLVVFFHSYVGVRYFPDAAKINLPFVYKYGYLGVNLFFAISGFIVGLVAEKPGFSTYSFLVKRFFRIYPLYWFFIGMAILFSFCNIAPAGGGNDLSFVNIAKNLLIFPIASEPIYAVGWSLEHEIIFYLLAGLLIPFISVRGLMVCMIMLGVTGIMVRPMWDYHLLSSPQLDFAVGLALFCFSRHAKAFGIVGPLVVGSLMYYLSTQEQIAFTALAGEAFILLGLINIPAQRFKTTLGPLVWIGDISYSLYLCHWILAVLGNYPSSWLGLPAWLAEPYRFALIAISILLAARLHARMEGPLVNFGNRVAGSYQMHNLRSSSSMSGMESLSFRKRHFMVLAVGCLTVSVAGVEKYYEFANSSLALREIDALLSAIAQSALLRDAEDGVLSIEKLEASGIRIPSTLTKNDTHMTNNWGGSVTLVKRQADVVVDWGGVPREACVDILFASHKFQGLVMIAGSLQSKDEHRPPVGKMAAWTSCKKIANTVRMAVRL